MPDSRMSGGTSCLGLCWIKIDATQEGLGRRRHLCCRRRGREGGLLAAAGSIHPTKCSQIVGASQASLPLWLLVPPRTLLSYPFSFQNTSNFPRRKEPPRLLGTAQGEVGGERLRGGWAALLCSTGPARPAPGAVENCAPGDAAQATGDLTGSGCSSRGRHQVSARHQEPCCLEPCSVAQQLALTRGCLMAGSCLGS